MLHLETGNKLPPAIRQHLIDRMRDRRITIADLNKLRIWVESRPLVPEGEWRRKGRKAECVNQADLLAGSRKGGRWEEPEHCLDGASRSQSVHKSDEGPQWVWSEGTQEGG